MLINRIKQFFDKQAFGVCEWWGNKIGINSNKIRIYFIYISFITLGSPIIIYLIMAFILDERKKIKNKKNKIWEI